MPDDVNIEQSGGQNQIGYAENVYIGVGEEGKPYARKPKGPRPLIFISYASADGSAYARQIEAALREQYDYATWWDYKQVPGKNWWHTIEQVIDDCDAMIVIMTRGARDSEWVEKEYEYALEHHKTVIPVRVRADFGPGKWPGVLSNRHAANVSADYAAGMQQLVDALPNLHLKAKAAAQSAAESSAPTLVSRLFDDAYAHFQAGEYGEALRLLDLCLRRAPDHEDAQYLRAIVQEQIWQLMDALGLDARRAQRRLEAAMPQQTKVNTRTELRVKISLSDSEGLRGELPAVVRSGDVIHKSDVVGSRFSLEFPLDERTKKLLPGSVCIEVVSEHFTANAVQEETKRCPMGQVGLQVPVESDSRTIIFDLTPKVLNIPLGRSRVMISVFQNDDLLAQTNVSTEIVREVEQLSFREFWAFAVVLLNAVVVSPTLIAGDVSGTGVVIGSGTISTENIAGQDAAPAQPAPAPEKLTASPVIRRALDIPIPELVVIPAGPFLMGSDPRHDPFVRENQKGDWVRRELPQITVTLPEYWIGKYPVTAGEYRAFVGAGGYVERRWWTEAGWQWRLAEKRTKPDYWDDKQWTGDARLPVVGVSWYEAWAYTQWLTAQIAGTNWTPGDSGGAGARHASPLQRHEWVFRLPTEAEWEKAARGMDGRIYPWDDKFDKNKCNTSESGINHTTPVGQYSPQGDSPYGCADMAGNVWEWCLMKVGGTWDKPVFWDYTKGAQTMDNTPEGKAGRVLRGGSWGNNRGYARAAARGRSYPDFGNDNFGFRVVRLLPPSL